MGTAEIIGLSLTGLGLFGGLFAWALRIVWKAARVIEKCTVMLGVQAERLDDHEDRLRHLEGGGRNRTGPSRGGGV